MADLPQSIPDEFQKRGRSFAQARGTSLIALVRELLDETVSSPVSLVSLATLILAVGSAHSAAIFSDNFDGSGATDLHGTTPDVTAGATWTASSNFKADGAFTGSAGSATVAFAPADGFVYTLDASVTGISGDGNWIAVGLANGQGTSAGTTNRFVNGSEAEGRAWMLARGDNSSLPNVAHTTGSTDPSNWTGAIANANGGDLDMRIVLDTTGGAGNWTATWYAKRPADGSYAEVRSTATLASEDIDSAGFAVSDAGVSGTIASFSLASSAAGSGELIHHWRLDGDATDSAGSADGTAVGGATYAPGRFGQAVSLDGIDDYISTATAGNAVLPDTDYTLMAWVFWEGGNGSRGYIAGGQNSGTNGEVFTMGKSADGTDRILFLNLLPNGGQGNSIAESADGAISTGTWHHVAYTVDSSNGSTLYLDGSAVGTNPTRTTHTASTTVFNIGNNPQTGTSNPFDGLIDDVAVFSGLLDTTRINQARTGGAENFDGDSVAPSIVAVDPSATGIYPRAQLTAIFSEDVVLVSGGTITLTDTDDGSGTRVINLPDASQVTASGAVLTISPGIPLEFATNYEVVISSGAIEDTASPVNAFPGTTSGQWTFSTAAEDLTAPMITLKSPLDNAPAVSRATAIVATFDDNILAGSGTITLRDLDDGSTTQVIPVTDPTEVTVSGNVLTISPAGPLAADRNYAVQIAAGAVKNFSDVGFTGVPETDVTSWNFRTKAVSPNVIFILGDDQSWYDYGFMRRPGVEKAALDLDPSIRQVARTPAIDRLADEGLAFVHGYSAPVCRPALASIITGTYPHQHWVTGNDLENRPPDAAVEARMQVFNPLPRTLVNVLGHACFQTGKWWEGNFANGGFTHGDTVNSTASGTAPTQWSGGKPGYVRARHGDWGLMTGRVDYVNDVQAPAHPIPYANTVRTVTDFIDARVAAEEPFFVWYAPFLPHDPFDPPAGLVAEYTALGLNSTDAKYYANIERFDGGVGAILDHLDAGGIADHTIILMICDNGRSFDLSTVGKLTPYESGVRTPILVRWPDRIKPGGAIEPQIVRTPVNMVDLVPTVHHALGVPTFPEMRGVDLLDPAAVADRDTVCGADYNVEILDLPDPRASLESRFAVRDGWKLILSANGGRELFHLYDTSSGNPVDPHETTNLAALHPGIVSDLTAAIVNWYAVEPNGAAHDFDAWISDPAFGIAPADQGFALDLDGDGLANGLEAWLGTHPGEWTAGLAGLETAGATTFTHPKNENPPSGLTGFYEWSLNLADWYAGDGADGPAGGPTVNISPNPVGSIAATATASEALERLFLRVGVVQN